MNARKIFASLAVLVLTLTQGGLQFIQSAHADTPDVSGYQEFSLAENSSCTLSTDKKVVYPAFVPSTDTYGYVMNITNKATNALSSYIYYGGVTKTSVSSCLIGTLNTTTNKCDVQGCLLGTQIGGSCYSCALPGGTLNTTTIKCEVAASTYANKGSCNKSLDFGCYATHITHQGTTVGSKIYYCDLGDSASTTTPFQCTKAAAQKTPTNLGGVVNVNSLDPTINYTYSAPSFDITTAALPEVVATNATGYDVKFYALQFASLPLVGDVVANGIMGQNLTPHTWINMGSLSLPTVVQTAINAFSSTTLTCGLNADLPSQVHGCDLKNIGTILGNVSAALSSSALSDLGNTVGSLGSVSANIAAVIAGLQGGNVDATTLQNLQDSLKNVTLPNFTATADSLDALADALQGANSCIALLGTDVSATITALRDTATSLRNLNTGLQGLSDGIAALSAPNQQPSAYLDGLSHLSDSLATTFQSLKDLQTSWSHLADSMKDISIPGVGNLSALAPVIQTTADLLNVVVGPTQALIPGLQKAASFLAKVSDLVEAIENKDTDGTIHALDVLANTTFFSDAQHRTIATLTAVNAIVETIKGLHNTQAPVLNTLSCSSVQTYQSDMVAYLDAQIASYTQLKTNITDLNAIVSIDGANINETIDHILANLTSIRSNFASVDVQSACDNAELTASQIQDKLDHIKAAFEDARGDLHDALAQAQDTIDNLKDQIKLQYTDIEGQINAIIGGIDGSIDHVLDLIPGLTQGTKDRISDLLHNQRDRLLEEIREFIKSAHTYLLDNKLDAPTFEGLACVDHNQQVSTSETVTFAMASHAKANEVWGYVATVTAPDASRSAYVLVGGDASDLTLDVANTGTYTMKVRTIGKDSFVHARSILAFLSTLDLSDTRLGRIRDLSQLQAKLDALNAAVGHWTQLSNEGVLKANDVIRFLDEIDALVAEYSTDTTRKGQAIRALFNDTATYTDISTTQPTASDMRVSAIAGEETSFTLQGYDTDPLTYTFAGVSSTSAVFTGTYTGNQTLPYSVSKLVGDCNVPLTAEANVDIRVINRPTVPNITLNGAASTAFSTRLTSTNTSDRRVTYIYTGTIGSLEDSEDGNTLVGAFPSTPGTYIVGHYNACIRAKGYEHPICSEAGVVTLIVPGSEGNGGGGGGGGGGGAGGFLPPSTGTTTGSTATGLLLDTGAPVDTGAVKCSIIGSPYKAEENKAYAYACTHNITTMQTIKAARIEDTVTRIEFAKMMSTYAKSILGKVADDSKVCSFTDLSGQSEELREFAILSCKLGIMGISMGTTFRPNATLTRAETATVISRLYGWAVDGNPYYINHIAAMKAKGFIKSDNPWIVELRGNIFIMLERIAEAQ